MIRSLMMCSLVLCLLACKDGRHITQKEPTPVTSVKAQILDPLK